jgi:RNA polymerase primary sigma factor
VTRRGSIGLVTIRPPLTREEEAALHVTIAEGGPRLSASAMGDRPERERTALRRSVRRGRQGEETLLAGTCGLVRQRVRDLGFAVDHDELEAAGLEGLVAALRNFDPSRGVRFATYANYWISKMVFAAISHRVPYPEGDLRLVIKYRRLRRSHPDRAAHASQVAGALKVTPSEASRIMNLSAAIAEGPSDSSQLGMAEGRHEHPNRETEWIIDSLRSTLGDQFADFWMWTGKVMTLEELGRQHGISKQAMAKRVAKWRRQVEASPDADRLLSWLRAQ